MKKALIVTNLFHASPRIPGLCKYLPEFGWEPVVLTMAIGENPEAKMGPPNNFKEKVRTIETPYYDFVGFIKKLFGLKPNLSSRDQVKQKFGKKSGEKSLMEKLIILGAAFIAYPDECWGWKPFAVKAGLKLLKNEKFDAILSSSSPVTSHLISKTLKGKTGVPWVADMRDLWTQNHNYQYPKIRKFFETKLEIRTLSQVDAFTTVSVPLVEHLQSRYKDKNIYSIPNGFDPGKVNEPPVSLTEKFTITYTGTIYQDKQDPTKLFAALRELINEKKIDPQKVEVRFYGVEQDWLENDIEKNGLVGIAKQYGKIPRSESYFRQNESQIALLFGWEDEKETGVCPTKLYEYLGARRPILATGGTKNEVFRKIIDKTRTGKHPLTTEEVKKSLLEYYEDYLKNGSVFYNPDLEAVEEYSYRSMAKKFVKAFETAGQNAKKT